MCDKSSPVFPLAASGTVRDAGHVAEALLTWYARARRDLPWRRTSDPYAIWASEVMLQQTQVATVVPYYERFLNAFPTLQDLAAAELDEVLAVWQGLGYYARARNLHAAARVVVAEHGGELPRDIRGLRALPGIGPYIAGALLSIAYGYDEVAVDANTARVLTRLGDYADDPTTGAGRRDLAGLAERLLPSGRAGAFNVAMMELGAIVCLPAQPQCTSCPVADHCLARRRGTQGERPARKPKREVPTRDVAAAVCMRRGADGEERVLILRRAPTGLLGGMWELPSVEICPGGRPAQALLCALLDDVGLTSEIGERTAQVRHAYSHFRVRAGVYGCRATGKADPRGAWDRSHWLAPSEEAAYGLTRLTTRILEETGWGQERRSEPPTGERRP